MMKDDAVQEMPWTSHLMTIAEFGEWIASRAEAGRSIDIETCELDRWKAYDADPYKFLDRKGELREQMKQVGTNRFVRSPESRGWISEDDLPPDKHKAMYDRIRRESEAYDVLSKGFGHAANTLKLRDETDFDTHLRSHRDAHGIIREKVLNFAVGRGVLDVRTVMYFVGFAIEAGIKAGRLRSEPPPSGA
jgi:hypothetical protein